MMKSITIKESEVYHNTSTSSGNGLACKFLVEQLISLDPDLTIVSVTNDTAASYSAYIRVMGSDVGFYIYNNGGYLYATTGVWLSDGSFDTPTGYKNAYSPDFLGYYYSYGTADDGWYPYLKVSVIGIDGALKYIAFQSSRTGTLLLYYGMITSDTLPDPVCVAGNQSDTISSVWPSLPSLPIGSKLPSVFYAEAVDGARLMSYVSYNDSNSPWIRAGYDYALVPIAYHAYGDTKGGVDIKWGGLYHLFSLCNTNGWVSTLCGEVVNINGGQVLSGGSVTVFCDA